MEIIMGMKKNKKINKLLNVNMSKPESMLKELKELEILLRTIKVLQKYI